MGYFAQIGRYLFVLLLRFAIRIAGHPRPLPSHVRHIASRDAGRTIKVNVYQPAKSAKPSPVLVNLHGSGFILPAHGSDDLFCREISRETAYTVLDVQYRLAPENPFPAALNDAEDVINWVLGQPAEFDTTRVAVSGFSAGGNLALALCGLFSRNTINTVLAYYPSTNKSVDASTRKAPDNTGRLVPLAISRLFDDCYIPSTADRTDPRISPLFANPDAFPKNVLIITAACDGLCLEGEALAAKINTKDRNVVCRRMEKCSHAWDKSVKPGTVQEKARDDAYQMAVDMLH